MRALEETCTEIVARCDLGTGASGRTHLRVMVPVRSESKGQVGGSVQARVLAGEAARAVAGRGRWMGYERRGRC